MVLRLTLTILFGCGLAIGLFWLLWHMTSVPVDAGDVVAATRIEFTRMRHDSEVQTKIRKKPEREPPPPAPQVPQMTFSFASVDNAQIPPMMPQVAIGGVSGISLGLGGMYVQLTPLVRIPPQYPRRALFAGIEGWVVVQLTITETGQVTNATVVDSEPSGVFEEAALNAVRRWRFKPAIEDGIAVVSRGQVRINFSLNEKS
ncbi:MAG: energy transducer TonB [Nitrococcus sp.]|nr:energy transducer TonB [Nitrococcus sp.]